MKIRTSLITPFLKHKLGYASKHGISVWSLVDEALKRSGITNIPLAKEEKYKLALLQCENLGLKREIKKRFHYKSTSRILDSAKSNDFLSSYEWRKVRMQALELHGARCQCCGISPKEGAVMHVDHIKPRRTHPELALDIDNLQILCEACNHGKGNWSTTDWRESEEISEEVKNHIRSIMQE